jgi:hypothetical protein
MHMTIYCNVAIIMDQHQQNGLQRHYYTSIINNGDWVTAKNWQTLDPKNLGFF